MYDNNLLTYYPLHFHYLCVLHLVLKLAVLQFYLQKEKDFILADNKELHNTVELLEHEYKKKNNTLDLRFENRKRMGFGKIKALLVNIIVMPFGILSFVHGIFASTYSSYEFFAFSKIYSIFNSSSSKIRKMKFQILDSKRIHT